MLPVGASLLAMVVNDNACCLETSAALKFIASKLAPTGSTAATYNFSRSRHEPSSLVTVPPASLHQRSMAGRAGWRLSGHLQPGHR
ncbi:hypothetical protein B0D71_26485 [Pseudomonas laurylsulfativorans]|uniref:Uncharacterized protein n=1 Tax=Pseudomonas laurylsulfativorans TaxID=1943631 RepID=A0A2S3VH74_9PSED|nr:hypothetical protein B0D71_26485 [Pseudomonas laurylsulfativorans]